jgi:hypothetical protein
MTNEEIEKLNRILNLLIEAYADNAQKIADVQGRTPGEHAVSPLASKESALQQARQELYSALKGKF